MTAFMFWNIQKKPLYDELAVACREHEIDILILAESTLHVPRLLHTLNSPDKRGYFQPSRPSPASRLQFFIRGLPTAFVPLHEARHFVIVRLRPSLGKDMLIIAAHLPSKLFANEGDQGLVLRNMIDEVVECELQLGHFTSLLIGDLNMNPFEDPVVGADMLHGVMDKSIAALEQRTVNDHKYRFFYNPMWSRMGDHSVGPPGTYFYNSGHVANYFWNTFDQVLLRPSLLPCFAPKNLRVLTRIGDSELIRADRIAKEYSDHLPIVLRLNLERMI